MIMISISLHVSLSDISKYKLDITRTRKFSTNIIVPLIYRTKYYVKLKYTDELRASGKQMCFITFSSHSQWSPFD